MGLTSLQHLGNAETEARFKVSSERLEKREIEPGWDIREQCKPSSDDTECKSDMSKYGYLEVFLEGAFDFEITGVDSICIIFVRLSPQLHICEDIKTEQIMHRLN